MAYDSNSSPNPPHSAGGLSQECDLVLDIDTAATPAAVGSSSSIPRVAENEDTTWMTAVSRDVNHVPSPAGSPTTPCPVSLSQQTPVSHGNHIYNGPITVQDNAIAIFGNACLTSLPEEQKSARNCEREQKRIRCSSYKPSEDQAIRAIGGAYAGSAPAVFAGSSRSIQDVESISPEIEDDDDAESEDDEEAEEAQIPLARDAKKCCVLRFAHRLEKYINFDSRGEWICCRWWIDGKALSFRGPHGLLTGTYEVLDPVAKLGHVLTCMLDMGCTAKAIIRRSKAEDLGWKKRRRTKATLHVVKTAMGQPLQPIGSLRLRVRCSETKIPVNARFLVVDDASFPIAEGVFGRDTLERKHLACNNRLCLTRYRLSLLGR